MKRYRLSVCKGPDCRGNGSDAVFAAAKEAVTQAGVSGRCAVFRGGCYGLCHLGANVIVREDIHPKDPFSKEDFQLMGWEDEYHYGACTPESVRRIVSEHIVLDRPVEALRTDSGDTETDTRPRSEPIVHPR